MEIQGFLRQFSRFAIKGLKSRKRASISENLSDLFFVAK